MPWQWHVSIFNLLRDLFTNVQNFPTHFRGFLVAVFERRSWRSRSRGNSESSKNLEELVIQGMGDPKPSHERCHLCSGPLSKDLVSLFDVVSSFLSRGLWLAVASYFFFNCILSSIFWSHHASDGRKRAAGPSHRWFEMAFRWWIPQPLSCWFRDWSLF